MRLTLPFSLGQGVKLSDLCLDFATQGSVACSLSLPQSELQFL